MVSTATVPQNNYKITPDLPVQGVILDYSSVPVDTTTISRALQPLKIVYPIKTIMLVTANAGGLEGSGSRVDSVSLPKVGYSSNCG